MAIKKNIVVVGADSLVGQHLTLALVSGGQNVFGLCTTQVEARKLEDHVLAVSKVAPGTPDEDCPGELFLLVSGLTDRDALFRLVQESFGTSQFDSLVFTKGYHPDFDRLPDLTTSILEARGLSSALFRELDRHGVALVNTVAAFLPRLSSTGPVVVVGADPDYGFEVIPSGFCPYVSAAVMAAQEQFILALRCDQRVRKMGIPIRYLRFGPVSCPLYEEGGPWPSEVSRPPHLLPVSRVVDEIMEALSEKGVRPEDLTKTFRA